MPTSSGTLRPASRSTSRAPAATASEAMLHERCIRINLDTGAASPPPWLPHLHTQVLPAASDGTTRPSAAGRASSQFADARGRGADTDTNTDTTRGGRSLSYQGS